MNFLTKCSCNSKQHSLCTHCDSSKGGQKKLPAFFISRSFRLQLRKQQGPAEQNALVSYIRLEHSTESCTAQYGPLKCGYIRPHLLASGTWPSTFVPSVFSVCCIIMT